MDSDAGQLKRNRARIFVIGAGLFLLGSQGPDLGDLFDSDRIEHHVEAKRAQITVEIDRADEAAERAAEVAERAARLAERAAEAAERASANR